MNNTRRDSGARRAPASSIPPSCLAALALLLALQPSLAAQAAPAGRAASELLGAATMAAIAADGRAVAASRDGAPKLLPAHPSAEPLRAAIAAAKPGILVEAVFFLPRPRPADQAARAAELASVYGLMRSVGSLQGIQYWSASRKAWRTFYEESWRLDGPEGSARLADPAPPAPGALPAAETVFVHQRDLSFGANRYRYEFASTPESVAVAATNLTRMSYGIVPVMAAGALTTRLLVIVAEDGIVFYAASGADAPGLLRGKLEDSFSNRAEALFNWFKDRYRAPGK